MNILKVFLVDDEMPAREELKYLLSLNDKVDLIGEADNLEDALVEITNKEIDLIFLDIQINNDNGVEFAKKIKLKEIGVVFATAYDEYAVEAFSLNAIDYLLKPFSQERVNQSIQKAIDKLSKGKKNERYLKKLTFWKGEKMVVIAPEDILYLTVDERKVILETTKGTLTDAGPLQNTFEKLDPNIFIRTHRSYIVNLEKIEEIIPWFNNTYNLKLVDLKETEIPVSRSYLQEFKKQVGLL
ncbi:response regulator transcription factor [Alkalicella caledoniensis]|uniref:Stage 0 sporulation protein A homolog n=1 Tax=Alkalicella caledoniensis TaxID=2731377 RepID=A0A7G9W939_ALKCA|nr:LytTR family DNA-binding domain-containing protein [Alkalicella caledoniensis]QNO15201.1 response regulator transcription factor [Alkalicella caledoniensis]